MSYLVTGDAGKIAQHLGWSPVESFASGLDKTIAWYLDHAAWVEGMTSGAYRHWIARQYGSTS